MITVRNNMDVNLIRLLCVYEYKLNQNTTNAALNINKAFGNDTVKERTVHRWQRKNISGDMNLENKPIRFTAPFMKFDELQKLFLSDPRETLREIIGQFSITFMNMEKSKIRISGFLMGSLKKKKKTEKSTGNLQFCDHLEQKWMYNNHCLSAQRLYAEGVQKQMT